MSGLRLFQTDVADLSGGTNAAEFATTDAPAKTDGDVAIWQSGNVVDGGTLYTGPANGASGSGCGAWYQQVPVGDMDGSNRGFFLDYVPEPAFAILTLNGAVQSPYSDYTLTGSTITYAVAPKASDWHVIWYFRCEAATSGAPKPISGYTYRRTITIDHTKVAADQTNFPVVIAGSYAWMANAPFEGGLGHMTNPSGYDVVFALDAAGSNLLNHEIDSYNYQTGEVAFWVKIPSVSASEDTVFYMFYGNSGISTDQSNKTAVWDANFAAVYHANGVGSTVPDSTVNSGSNTLIGFNAGITGQVASAEQYLLETMQSATGPSALPIGSGERTMEVWLNLTNLNSIGGEDYGSGSANPAFGWGGDGGTTGNRFVFVFDGNNHMQVNVGGDSYAISYPFGTYGNSWHHLVAVFPGGATTASQIQVYLDGALASGSGGSAVLNTVAEEIAMGGFPVTHTNPAFLNVDEARISRIARSADWILTSYNNQKSPATFYSIGSEVAL